MKRILSVLLSSIVAFSGVITANAAQTEKEIKKNKGIDFLEDSFIMPDNTMRLISTVNVDMPGIGNYTPIYNVKWIESSYEDKQKYEYKLYYSNNINEYNDIEIEEGEYGFTTSLSKRFDSTKTGGLYVKVKIKLSEFKECFNDKGHYYEDLFADKYLDYKYNKYEVIGYDASTFEILSGSYMKRTIPDENGEVEFYIHKSDIVGEKTYALIGVSYSDGKKQTATLKNEILEKLTLGNVDCNDDLDVKDVTALQLYIAGLSDLDELGLFHADTNNDGFYDVKDVTHLQLGIASLKG